MRDRDDGWVTNSSNGNNHQRKRMTGKERREQLLDIGRRLFAERGFEGTSIEEIAAQAGVLRAFRREGRAVRGRGGSRGGTVSRDGDGHSQRRQHQGEVRGGGGRPAPLYRGQLRRLPDPGSRLPRSRVR